MKLIINFSQTLIMVLVPLFISCQNGQIINQSYEEQKTNYLNKKLAVKKDVWELNATDTISSWFFSAKKIGNEQYSALFDSKKNKIKILSISQKKIINEITLPDLRIKGNGFESLFFHNFDSIFVQLTNNILLIDTAGRVKFNILINQSGNSKTRISNIGNGLPLSFDAASNELLMGQYCSKCPFYDKSFFLNNVETSLDLTTKKFKQIPFVYSFKYQNDYYGFASNAQRLIRDSLSIFTFHNDPNIYIFNRRSNTTFTKGGKSQFDTGIKGLSLIHKNDSNKKMNHLTLSPIYLDMYWDPYQKLYYRIFLKEQSEKDKDGAYNTWMDKPVVLMVFDENFDLLNELELEPMLNYRSAFVTPNGFFIGFSNTENLSKLTFKIFKFEK